MEQLLLTPRFAPSPNQFIPKFGAPSTNVTLFGKNFDMGTVVVRFGTTAATIVRAPTATQIVATVPAMAKGAVKIKIETGGGSVISDDTFTVLSQPPPTFAPSPNQFNPNFGPAGSNVALFGNNFNVGTVSVRFGTTAATIVGVPTATQIVATVPAAMAPGAVKIRIETGGGSVTSDDSFTIIPVPPPTFAPSPNQFNPKFGPPGTNVTLFGNNFNVGTVSVRFGGTAATIVGVPTATQIVATVPAMAPGAVKITVQTDGGSITSNDDFTGT